MQSKLRRALLLRAIASRSVGGMGLVVARRSQSTRLFHSVSRRTNSVPLRALRPDPLPDSISLTQTTAQARSALP
jgi:hypothetical protein